MKEIQLTKGYVAMVDDAMFDELNKYYWQAKVQKRVVYAARTHTDGGVRIEIKMHRQIIGDSCIGMLVDHFDGDGLNNQLTNLRLATRSQNGMNSKPNYNKKYKGVDFYKRKGLFRARIKLDRKLIELGYYENEALAAKSYNDAAIIYFGEFARLNII